MLKLTELNDFDSSSSEESVQVIVASPEQLVSEVSEEEEPVKGKRERSWVYQHSEKRVIKGKDPDFNDNEFDQYAEEIKDVTTKSNVVSRVSLVVMKGKETSCVY